MALFSNATCESDRECLLRIPNTVCSRESKVCLCNPWYAWGGSNCSDIDSTGPIFLLVVWGFIAVISFFGIIFGIWDFFRAKRSYKENVKSSKRINAAMSTTLNGTIALFLLFIWSCLSIASIFLVGKQPSLDFVNEEWLSSISSHGKFEFLTIFIAPLSLIVCSLSLMRTSLMWIEIAARSRSMRPVVGANFRRTNRVLIVQHILLLGLMVVCWGLSFGIYRSDERFSVRLIMSVASIPICIAVLALFMVGSTQLRAVLVQARKTVYAAHEGAGGGADTSNNDQSNEQSAGAAAGTGRRSLIPSLPKRLSKSSLESPDMTPSPAQAQSQSGETRIRVSNGGLVGGDRRASGGRGSGGDRRGSDGTDMVVVRAGGSELPPPNIANGGNALRASRWNRHAKIVGRTNVLVMIVVLIGMLAMIAFTALDILYGWRDSPQINGMLSVETILWMVGPVCLLLSQIIILGYVHVASTKMKASSIGNSSGIGPRKRKTTWIWGSSSNLTKRERQTSLIPYQQQNQDTVNPGFHANPYLKKTLSHIREETAFASNLSQFVPPQDPSPKAESRLLDGVSLSNRATDSETDRPVFNFATATAHGGGSFSSFGSFIGDKSDDTSSADSGLVVLIDDMIPPPPPLRKSDLR